jgi:MoaA/NifB/PqqE/SkfB family radical SAM enzyme
MNKLNLFKGYHYSIEEYNRTRENGGFTQLSLDLSSNCNYRCDWCFNLDLLRKDSEDLLTLGDKQSLLEQSVELGAKTIVFPGTGEPTLDADFYNLIDFAHKLGITAVVYSNLTGNLDSDKISQLFEKGVSIGIKLDSLKPEIFHERYHVGRTTYNKFLENLEYVSKTYAGSQEELPQGIAYRVIGNTVLTHENKKELPQLVDKCAELGFPMFVRPVKPVTWARENSNLWKKLGNSSGSYVPDSELVSIANRYNTLFSPSSTLENHCAIYSFGLTVKNNGDIQICPDHHESRGSFGNVRDTSLKEVMKSLNEQRKIQPGYCVMLADIQH